MRLGDSSACTRVGMVCSAHTIARAAAVRRTFHLRECSRQRILGIEATAWCTRRSAFAIGDLAPLRTVVRRGAYAQHRGRTEADMKMGVLGTGMVGATIGAKLVS